MADEAPIDLDGVVQTNESAADKVALGDLDIRRRFARDIMVLFIVANAFVFVAHAAVFWGDNAQLATCEAPTDQRIIVGKVVISPSAATPSSSVRRSNHGGQISA